MFGLLVVILFVFISRYQTLPFGQFVPSLYHDVAGGKALCSHEVVVMLHFIIRN